MMPPCVSIFSFLVVALAQCAYGKYKLLEINIYND